MDIRTIEKFQETLVTHTCASGLSLVIVPKPAFARTYVTATLRFGSKHLHHPTKPIPFPAGIAHFLEHKMFELPTGDAASQFAALGATTNAFTSFDKTTYLFRTIDHVDEATVLLLDMIQSLTIDDASVIKEKGIIQEEIAMYEDMPDSVLFWRTMHNLFVDHPLTYDIAGTSQSVDAINVNDLHTCHQTYYHPTNTLVVIVGPVDPAHMIALIEANQASKTFKEVLVPNGPAYEEAMRTTYDTITHLEAQDKLMMAYKQSSAIYPAGFLKYRFAMNIYLEIMFGPTSDFYERLVDQGVINDSFSAFSFVEPDMALAFFGGDTKKPDVLFDAIKDTLALVPTSEEIQVVQQRMLGSFIRSLHSLESLAHDITNYAVVEEDVFAAIDVIQSLTFADIKEIPAFFEEHRKTVTMLHGKRH
jgi:predicted Zn-dependent peptidase